MSKALCVPACPIRPVSLQGSRWLLAEGGRRGHALRMLALLAEGELNVSDLTRYSRPVTAAHLAPSQADGRGRADRTESRRRLGILPHRRAPARALARAFVAAARSADPTRQPRPARLEAVRSRAPEAAPGLFRPARRGVGPHPLAACTGRGGGGGDARFVGARPLRALLDLGTGTGRMLELLAPRAARPSASTASRDMLAVARANLERAGLRERSCARATSMRRRSSATPSTSSSCTRCCTSSTIPAGRCARRRRAGARAGGCSSSISRRMGWSSCARSTRIGGSASRATRSRRGSTRPASTRFAPRLAADQAKPASSPCRSGSGATAASSPTALTLQRGGRLMSRAPCPRQPPCGPRRIRVSFEFFPPKTDETEETPLGGDRAARAARARLRLGDLWRGRLDPRAHACDRRAPRARDRRCSPPRT